MHPVSAALYLAELLQVKSRVDCFRFGSSDLDNSFVRRHILRVIFEPHRCSVQHSGCVFGRGRVDRLVVDEAGGNRLAVLLSLKRKFFAKVLGLWGLIGGGGRRRGGGSLAQ